MTDNLDSGQSTQTPASPNAGGLNGQGDKQSSGFDAAKLQSTIEALTRKLDEVDKRSASLQGDKDRAVTKTAKEVDDLKRKIAEIEKLKGSGLDSDAAIEEFSFREDVRAIKDQLSKLGQAPATPAGNEQSGADAAKVVEQYGFTKEDVDAQALARLHGSDPEKLEGELAKLAFKRQRTPPAPDAVVQGAVSRPANADQLTQEYKTKMIAARGNKALGQQIKAEYEKKGVPVHEVNFSV